MTIKPLADRVRPETLEEFFGQDGLLGEGAFLKRAIEEDKIPSMIFWGPPGCGKTTLAYIIAKKVNAEFVQLSAVSSGKKRLLEIVAMARENLKYGKKTILFIDEIHRWNKAQQDVLLPFVENGLVTLIGATTENPSFEINSALISRSRVLVFQKLKKDDIKNIILTALKKLEIDFCEDNKEKTGKRGIGSAAVDFIADISGGDGRMALNTLELAVNYFSDEKTGIIGVNEVKKVIERQHIYYDKNGEEHYNIISALHKSMRGGDADAALFWLARMVEGGENPLYIARRLVRFASEDVGLADNHALILANSTYQACHNIGLPECGVVLAQCVIYLAKTKKSILAYEAWQNALEDAKKFANLPVPIHLRNAPTKLMEELGYGKNYKYTPKENSDNQEYFPKELKGKKYLNN